MIVFNSQTNSDHIRAVFDIKKDFSIEHPQNFILIPSSGSTLQAGDHRVFAFDRQQILNSAARVNKHFRLTQDLNWGCVLPLFHVGGLGIMARAHLSHSKVFYNTWPEFSTEWITENNIGLLSLVPTQIFDLVAKGMRAPNCVKYVFVGGAHLDQHLQKEALNLGWPLELTYGMTETGSMIAFKKSNGLFQLFDGVKIVSRENKNFVQTNSLANFQLNYASGSIVTTELNANNAGVELPDAIEIFDNGQFALLGRADDQIKISGELVNLNAIRALLPDAEAHHLDIVAIDDLRKGKRIVLVCELVSRADSELVSRADSELAGSAAENQMVGEKQKLDDLKVLALKLNAGLKKFEKIELLAVVKRFPRSGLNKIKRTELKDELEKGNKYENV